MIAGTALRKSRALGEVLSDTINILIAHWRQLAVISIPVVVANVAFSLVILAITQDLPTAEEIQNETADFSVEDAAEFVMLLSLVLLIALPVFFVLQQLVAGGAVVYLDETDKGHEPAPADALDQAQARLGILVGATLRAMVIVLLMAITIVGIPWAINRLVRWVLVAQVVMIEGKRGQEVLARSAELVAGRWWNTFGRLLIMGLVIGIPIGILQQALASAFPGVAGSILSSATGFISVPFGIIAVSLMFFDLRARKGVADGPAPESHP